MAWDPGPLAGEETAPRGPATDGRYAVPRDPERQPGVAPPDTDRCPSRGRGGSALSIVRSRGIGIRESGVWSAQVVSRTRWLGGHPGLGPRAPSRSGAVVSAHETAWLDEPAARSLVQRAERGSAIDRQHGGAFGADSPKRKARNGGAAHRYPLVVSRSSRTPVAHVVPPRARTSSGRVGWTETAEMLSGDGSSRWTARCSLPLWVHRAPHRVQNAGRRALTTMTTRADSQTGHLAWRPPVALPDSWGSEGRVAAGLPSAGRCANHRPIGLCGECSGRDTANGR